MTDVKDAEGIYCKYNVTMISPHSLPICLSSLCVAGKVDLFWKATFICRPSDSSVSEDAGIEPKTIATSTLAVRRSNHSVRSHPQTQIDLIHRLS